MICNVGAESKGDPVKKSPYGIRFRTGLYISEEDLPEILRHGIEHHLYNSFRRSDVVGQDPFLCHADRAHTIKPDAVTSVKTEETKETSIKPADIVENAAKGQTFDDDELYLSSVIEILRKNSGNNF